MASFGIKDILDIVLVAFLLYYLYKLMKESGSINIFYGVLAFIGVWILASIIFDLRLTGTILDKFMSIGLIVLVVLFQDQIKRFLVDIGSRKKWRVLSSLFHKHGHDAEKEEQFRTVIMPIVYACMNMSKTKTGALIVIEQNVSLAEYEKTGDIIDARINQRVIENIFFKNSPLHDGALILSHERLTAAGCILPVSHDTDIPRSLGLRHRSALGISQATDAFAIIVSEETGNISYAHRGHITTKVTTAELENQLSQLNFSL